jgi:hypothetical protein
MLLLFVTISEGGGGVASWPQLEKLLGKRGKEKGEIFKDMQKRKDESKRKVIREKK